MLTKESKLEVVKMIVAFAAMVFRSVFASRTSSLTGRWWLKSRQLKLSIDGLKEEKNIRIDSSILQLENANLVGAAFMIFSTD
jgi:hypothetical protein